MIDPITRITVLPIWTSQVRPTLLPGGLGNQSYIVDDEGRKFVVRFGRDHPQQHVFRAWELMVSQAAHQAGFASEIVYTGPGVFVGVFIDGKNCTPQDVRDKADDIVLLLKRFHLEMPRYISGAAHMFWPFHTVRDYARTLGNERHRNAGMLGEWFDAAEELESAQAPLPIVFGHNDLVHRNIVDDGTRIWFVDYEHAGFTTSVCDLAGLASHSSFDDAQLDHVLDLYFGPHPSDDVRRSFDAAFAIMPLREALWGMLAETHLDIPQVDYFAYGAQKLEVHREALARFRRRWP
jgi:thiamine kinase-like enzyme